MRWFVEIGQTADHTRRHVVNDAVAIFHPPFLLSLMIFGWAAVIETFQRHGVEYHRALRIVDEDRLRPFDIFQLGICILLSSIYSFVGYIILRGFMDQLYMSTVLAIALYVLIPVAFSLYYRVHHRSSFQSLRETLHAILFALFAKEVPSFREVFLANIITSLAKVFSDAISAMFLLIHLLGVPHVDAIFGPKSFAALIFTCFPFILCLFLSLRLGYSGKTIQYWNALKHLMTMSVTVLSSMKFLIDDENTWLAQYFYPWITLVSLNTVVSFAWDVKVDWRMTLTRWIPPRPILQSKIFTEEQRWAWYLIIVCDFILRGSWTLRLSISFFTSSWIALVLSIGEIARRSVWMMVRVEAEIDNMLLAAQTGNEARNGQASLPLGP